MFGSVGLLLYVRQGELLACKVFVHDAAYLEYGLGGLLDAVARGDDFLRNCAVKM